MFNAARAPSLGKTHIHTTVPGPAAVARLRVSRPPCRGGDTAPAENTPGESPRGRPPLTQERQDKPREQNKGSECGFTFQKRRAGTGAYVAYRCLYPPALDNKRTGAGAREWAARTRRG